jgi:acyl carrier protein
MQIFRSQSVSQPSELSLPPKSQVTPAQLRHLIAGIDTLIDIIKLKDNTPFRDAGADSFDFFTLILAVQDAYRITIPDEDVGKISTLDALARYLNEMAS